jgi:hypothetical protein
MTKSTLLGFARIPAIFLLGLSLAAAPALADKGGNGNGGGNGGSRAESSKGNGGGAKTEKSEKTEKAEKAGKSKSGQTDEDDDDDTDEGDDDTGGKSKTGVSASAAGKLNGFLHASPRAIERASEKSALGRVVSEYGSLLDDYISPDAGETAPTADELADALSKLSNKRVTAEVIAAVNAKLVDVDAKLEADLTASGKTIAEINAEISASLSD